jgi:hypothetical protein
MKFPGFLSKIIALTKISPQDQATNTQKSKRIKPMRNCQANNPRHAETRQSRAICGAGLAEIRPLRPVFR